MPELKLLLFIEDTFRSKPKKYNKSITLSLSAILRIRDRYTKKPALKKQMNHRAAEW